MVHRAPDSRLLTNLIANEKEHTKHLAALFPLSHAALASLSAYAAASPASPAHAIAAVVDLLASADDALQRYTHAIDAWREQLTSLKALEDDLAAVLRDRDILVTRLIKASKATRETHRSSKHITPLSGLGSASLSSLPSTNSTTTHSASASGTGPASTNTKLAQAQAELQACEAHLVNKERELDARRISVARDGLGARCRALIDCGWIWGEMGKQGLRALQALSANGPSHTGSGSAQPSHASDSSSVTPSQSASQTVVRSPSTSHEGTASRESEPQTDLTITLPPAHSISEFTLPVVRSPVPQNGDAGANTHAQPTSGPTAPPLPSVRRKRTRRPRRPPSQHIAEVSDEGSDANAHATAGVNVRSASPTHTPFPTTTRSTNEGQDSSSEDEHAGPLKIVDNDPFEVIRRRSALGPSPSVPILPTVPAADLSSETSPSPSKPTFPSLGPGRRTGTGPTLPSAVTPKRERRTSTAFFGSLRGLFRKTKERERVGVVSDEGPSREGPSGNKPLMNGGWVTRTDARIKGRGNEDSDDEGTVMAAVNVARGQSGRLRKGRPRGVQETSAAGPSREDPSISVDGWVTDVPGKATNAGTDRLGTRRGTIRRHKTSVADLRGSEQGHTDGEVERASSKGRTKVKEVPGKVPARGGSVDVHLGRAVTTTATSRRTSESHRRSASLNVVDPHVAFMSASGTTATVGRTPSPPLPPLPPSAPSAPWQSKTSTPPQPAPANGHGRRATGNGHATHANVHRHVQNQSLMSIVADVARWDEGDERAQKAHSMDVPRAPGSVLRGVGARRASEDAGHGQGQGSGRGTVKMPLRSALRTSRTPSPVPSPVPVGNDADKTEPATMREAPKEGSRGASPVSPRDSVSVSSYATGRESLDEGFVDADERPTSVRLSAPVLTIPPPPADPPPMRRKSVRVSLQPTFSPSPPALFDDDRDTDQDQDRNGHGSGSGFGSGRRQPWDDSSSDEDEEYNRARALLSLVGKEKGKGPARR